MQSVPREILDQYEVVVGLEVHAQLLTNSKAFSSDRNEYGNLPNTNTNAVSLGHPGTLPVLNERSVEFAVRLGLALNARITKDNRFARKNYFYADLPKGYQITQDDTPICTGGYVGIGDAHGKERRIGLVRIHMEEDSGKSIHDLSPFDTMIDLNRAGVPLVEIVSEPEIRSGEEAYAYLWEMRKLLRYLEVCDGNMEEGSMRCDANISVRKIGDTVFGTRVEVKNLNSMRNVKRAIDFEKERQVALLLKGEKVRKTTLTFNADTGETAVMRDKEEADDYRYFPEPDLQPYVVTDAFIEKVRMVLPPLPSALFRRYTTDLGLSEYDAAILTEEKSIALYFEELLKHVSNAKSAANWMMGEVKGYLNSMAIEIGGFPLAPARLAELITLVDRGTMAKTMAAQQVFPLMLASPEKSAEEIIREHGLIQVSDDSELRQWVESAIAKYPEKVMEFRGGKRGIIGLFMGEVMRMSGGKADPKKTSTFIQSILENQQP